MKKLLIIACSFFFLTNNSFTQEYKIALWPAGSVPNYKKTNEVEKSDSGNFVSIRLVQQPAIDVYLPSKGNITGQAVVICPGGSYSFLAYDWEGIDIAKWLNANGIAAIVLKYRLPISKSNIDPKLSPLLDAQRAIRIVRANAEKWNIKRDKIGIMGFSAGGHLASTAGTHFDKGNANAVDTIDRLSSRPDFMILIYPVISMSKSYMHRGSKNNLIGANADSATAKFYSNDLQVTKETPPTLLVHSTDDDAVPVENSLSFYQALKNNGVPAEMHIYPYGGHGFSLAIGRGYLSTWTDRCIDWIRSLNK
jgi:acetyl esterase/lipase